MMCCLFCNFSASKGLIVMIPIEKTNEPTPRSINEVPQVSTLAKALGKIGKSTARIEIDVRINIEDRYAVRDGFCGK
ncbi:hypothetical protein WICPIJ_002402 [Wickerhamomyces pijperi]|uniref:Uncharacterized protein n=1 Tax=Wickerhamomyces pijperi TaxID=599730 RepID=A0A9P8Q965_WICPI|nr:hypothetical protein WICPIJ_002402 [Wickerhamomyces pijperi]